MILEIIVGIAVAWLALAVVIGWIAIVNILMNV